MNSWRRCAAGPRPAARTPKVWRPKTSRHSRNGWTSEPESPRKPPRLPSVRGRGGNSRQRGGRRGCHPPELAFTDGRARALGATGESVKHSAMSLANVAYNAAFTWSGAKIRSLESQMRQPLFNQHPVEMGLRNGGGGAVQALSAEADYRGQFAAAFPGDTAPISMANIIKAIAAFERSLISGRSPFDRYVYDDDPTALSDPEKHGMPFFFSVL